MAAVIRKRSRKHLSLKWSAMEHAISKFNAHVQMYAGLCCWVVFVVAGCASNVPDMASVTFLNGPEKIPLRVGLMLDRLEGGNEPLAQVYSSRCSTCKGAVEVGSPLGQALLEGFKRTFFDVRKVVGNVEDDGVDLVIRPRYRISANTSRGQYRSMNGVVDLDITDRLGNEVRITTGTIGGSSDGPFRTWRGYVAVPFWLFGMIWLEHDSWAQAVAGFGRNTVLELDSRLRAAPIVLDAVKRQQALSAPDVGELSQNGLRPVFERFARELLSVPGRRVPVSVAIGPVQVQQGPFTQWESFVEDMLWTEFPRPLDQKLVKRKDARKALAELDGDGADWTQSVTAIRYASDLGVESVLLISTIHEGDQLVLSGKLVDGRTGEDLHRSSVRIVKSWRPTVIPDIQLSPGG